MTDQTNSDPSIEGVGSNWTPADYTVAPEHAQIAAAIVATDPLSLPGASSANEGATLPEIKSIDGLPPALREAAKAKLVGVPQARRAEAEAGAIREVLEANSLDMRGRTGFAREGLAGLEVSEYYHCKAELVREHNEALKEYDRLNVQLTEVSRYEVGEDGQPRPIYVMSAEQQRLTAIRQRDLLYRASLLMNEDGTPGVEGKRRLDKALYESVQQKLQLDEQLAIEAEARALAPKLVRDDEVQRRAEVYARGLRPHK